MSNTPTVRMTSSAWNLKLTPSNSPFTRSSTNKSPVKASRHEVTLSLKQAIGTTTASANAFDSLPSACSFAFTAGAAAVIATVDENQQVTQRFFRARPNATPINQTTSVYGPATPTNNSGDSRGRTTTSLRDVGIGGSPFGSPGFDWAESPSNKPWATRERVKAATCVSFSPDGKYLAVGETGYKPRVLIFSTSHDAPSDTPLTCLSDHTFGVKAVAFSHDSQYLATLGSANDGFLYIWNIMSRNGTATLLASNKCTSNVTRMAWIGSNLITVGTRHVKVWRIDEPHAPSPSTRPRQSEITSLIVSPLHKTLPGRNCLLGPLLEANFTCVVGVAPGKAIICSEKGDICLLDDTDGTQRFHKIGEAGFGVSAMTVDAASRLHVAGAQGSVRSLNINDILAVQTPPPSPPPGVEAPVVALACESTYIHAMAPLVDMLVTVDSQRVIRLSRLNSTGEESSIGSTLQQLPAHGDAVLGVSPLPLPNAKHAAFFTWSTGGNVLFWNKDGMGKGDVHIELEQIGSADEDINELKVVRAYSGTDYLVSGDKYGVLRVTDTATKECTFIFKAHAGEITDISVHEGDIPYIACGGRDRTVQVFWNRDGLWELLQTLDEHVGAITKVLFTPNASRLLSSSSDRTVVVRERVSREEEGTIMNAFLIRRTLTLKATPISITLDTDQDDVLLVSTIDRQIHRYDLRNGQNLNNFRAADGEGGDAVVLSSIAHVTTPRGGSIVVGVSSTDKSLRMYDDSGCLLARDWGHTEGISDVALVTLEKTVEEEPAPRILVTVAIDGTIFIWSLVFRPVNRHDLSKSMDLMGVESTNRDLLASKPPLRRVLSQSELARFQKNPDEEATTTPGGSKSPPRIRKRPSKFSLSQTPKLEPSPMPSLRANYTTPTFAEPTGRKSRNRSPSPPSPQSGQLTKTRRPSVDVRTRTKNTGNGSEFGSLGASTEQLCRTLRAYRKRLANSSDSLSQETMKELERELGLTARAVGEKAIKSKSIDEAVMYKLLDQFSERLVLMLDEKIAATVAREVRQNSESGPAGGNGGAAAASSEPHTTALESTATATAAVEAAANETAAQTDEARGSHEC